MPLDVLGTAWRQANQATRYPFLETASLTAADGSVLLEGVVLDAALYPVGGQAGLYLSQVVVAAGTVTVWIGQPGTAQLASGSFDPTRPPDLLALADGAGRPAGVLVSSRGQLGLLQSWGPGTHTFAPGATAFVGSVCVPTPEVGVRGLVLDDGSVFSGNVWIVGGAGVVVGPGQGLQEVRIDVVGDPLYALALCGGAPPPAFVAGIQVVSDSGTFTLVPDDQGQVRLMAADADASDGVLRVTTGAAGLQIGAVGATLGAGETA
jgi:hypothetical protein